MAKNSKGLAFAVLLVVGLVFVIMAFTEQSVASVPTTVNQVTFVSNTSSCTTLAAGTLLNQGFNLRFKTVDTNNVSVTVNFEVQILSGNVPTSVKIQMGYSNINLGTPTCGAAAFGQTNIGNPYFVLSSVSNMTYSYSFVISGLLTKTTYIVDAILTLKGASAASIFLNPQMTVHFT